MNAKVITTLLVFFLVGQVQSYKILFLVPFPGPSHWLMLKHFIRELTEVRGHEVTCITSFKFGEPLSRYQEVLIEPAYPIREKFPLSAIFNTATYSSDYNNLFLYWKMGLDTSRFALESQAVQQFIKRNDLSFDLVVSEQFFQESWLMFAHKFNAPIVTISTYGYSDFMDRAMGILTPWSFVPHMILDYEDDMNFLQRAYNVLVSSVDYVIRELYYLPQQDKLAKEFFGDLVRERGPLPSVRELEKSISVILINAHPTLTKPRPSTVGLVNIAGAHIRHPKPLPEDLQRFMDGAEHGVIYFSLGAYLQSSEIPPAKRATLLKVFSNLKQRVIWKFETDTIEDVPKNVMIRKWAPQNDILAHKNVILFISHGGQFGTFESMYHGVPTLFMPFFGDQHRNALRAVRSGYAGHMMFQDVTEESFGARIRQLIEDRTFYTRAKEISALFRDTIVEPMNESIYWMEYVVRHKGATHLKSKAVNLSIAQYLSLDVLGAVMLVVVIFFAGVKVCCCGKVGRKVNKKKTQ
ncbi:UDP-glycosyltransferase UGT5-like [Culex pipiens pallens]|uniref:UDP-glycosyltransferase UGT5-like n=1 Tax=Culex pipiens pallens TaxID=42434 RepID=UPI0019533297|nr:UDP-glycosyltransferase UGT5-like [Culex pipiens pallens]